MPASRREILRGEGDGAATAIYAAAYGRDPAFFDFYRSMQALTIALPRDTTTYVGPPDGDFFRYFLGNSDNPEAPPRQPGCEPTGGAGDDARPPRPSLAGVDMASGLGDVLTALGLVLVIEGLTFAAAPERRQAGPGGPAAPAGRACCGPWASSPCSPGWCWSGSSGAEPPRARAITKNLTRHARKWPILLPMADGPAPALDRTWSRPRS